MKATPTVKPAPVHATTDSDLLKQIDHYYPNLTGWLKELRDRFEESYRDRFEETPAEIPSPLGEVSCPACGTTLKVDQA